MATTEIFGKVVSNKMAKSVVVTVERQVRHGTYGKQQRLTSQAAVANVRSELAALTGVFAGLEPKPAGLDGLKRDLKAINEALWDIENRTRAKEAAKVFDQEFIELTRSVYLNNDKRAGIKRRINELLNSGLVEEKQYTSYGAKSDSAKSESDR